ncbi:MAG: response regulator transcription factor [Chloroflexi bacterium]|nr:response regulator transcription factor [Chloroflexota bacterium]MBP8055625.1 response regulator transcription factor [Chloroflexota bacterium]
MSHTILLVDDEPRLLSLVKAYLVQGGYRVLTANNGREALLISRQEKPDLVLLDIMMPEMDGYEFMRLHRRERNTPIILLTARVEEEDKVVGLELGADDYVTKPFSPRELTARVRALLRRAVAEPLVSDILRVGEMMVDRVGHVAKIGEQVLDLTPSEFALLATMLASPGKVFSRSELLEQLPGDNLEGLERTVDAHIKNLRAKLGDDPRQPRYIETVYGVGYRVSES